MKRLIIWAAALHFLAVLVAAATTGHGLVEPVAGYRLSVFWLSSETLDARVGALFANARVHEALVYEGAHVVSVALILALSLVAAIRGALGKADYICPIRPAAVVFGGIVGLMILARLMRPVLDMAAEIPSASTMMSAMPAYWFLGLATSASIVAAYTAFASHDLAFWLRGEAEKRFPALTRPASTPGA